MATGKVMCTGYGIFGEVWTCVFEICKQTCVQTDRHTDMLIATFCIRLEGGVPSVL